MTAPRSKILEVLLVFAILLSVLTWFSVRYTTARWMNVPASPSAPATTAFALGDAQFAYRVVGTMLQNMGDTGGRSTPLKAYDYNALADWFFLGDKLDSKSHYVPFLAAFYFGGVTETEKLPPLIEYLAVIGQRPGEERWRWLAQAVYIARWNLKDTDWALALAQKLANLEEPGLPLWTRQMPAFIMNATGNKEEAAAVMLEILKTSADNIHPNEVNFTKDYICTRILAVEEAAKRSMCQNIP